MDISSVTKVLETDCQQTVNKYIEEGWFLLSAVGGQRNDGNNLEPYTLYSLGYAKKSELVSQPEKAPQFQTQVT